MVIAHHCVWLQILKESAENLVNTAFVLVSVGRFSVALSKAKGISTSTRENCQRNSVFGGRTSSGRLTTKPFSAWPTSAWRKYSLQAASTARCPRNSLPSTRTVTSHRISCFRWSLRQRRILVQ